MCSSCWPTFSFVLDTVKRFGIDGFEYALSFFASLSSIPAQAEEVYDHTKDLLGGWFEVVKEKKDTDEDGLGIKYWCRLISYFSSVPSLIAHISPKFDADMEWCLQNGGYDVDYERYLKLFPNLERWVKLGSMIKACETRKSTFILFQRYSGDGRRCVTLSNDQRHSLLDLYIDHLTRMEEVSEGSIDNQYCAICVESISFIHRYFPKILQSLKGILDRGSRTILGGTIPFNLLSILRKVSELSSTSTTRFVLVNLIKPYLGDWLHHTNY
ncbi:hypothetical protein ADUPG1_011706 [Aduncisulcus paluster]|uniref:Uncharacterized protein n=1 Tax=Aduncisulcus paluster TaxID=2918883 RepID=A0ABQ5JWS1_9EUKA|nr:hypothetical protein ADUPG1_011706 [Aduncisulcus paluster]